jgi:hypothetical protein
MCDWSIILKKLREICEGREGETEKREGMGGREGGRGGGGESTFLDPENPADSVKKYANGRRIKRHRLQPRNTSFHRPTMYIQKS